MNHIVKSGGLLLAATLFLPFGSGGTASAQTAKQQEIRQLQAELARVRTQLSVANSEYRAAQAQTAAALDRVSNGFGAAGLSAQVLTLLGPVGKVAKASVWTARAYDAAVASVRAGRFTTTKTELKTLLANLEQARLDACSPWVNRATGLINRLRALGVQNP